MIKQTARRWLKLIVYVIGSFGIASGISRLVIKPLLKSRSWQELLGEALAAACALLLNRWLLHQHVSWHHENHPWHWWAYALAIIAMAAADRSDWMHFWPNLVMAALVAVFEEYLFRGVLLGQLLAINQQFSRKHLWIIIVLAGAAFGATHLINLLSGQTLTATLAQVLYASTMGMLFCVLYLRSHGLMIGIIIHFAIDFLNFSVDGFTNSKAMNQANTSVLPGVILALVFLVIAMLVYLPGRKAISEQAQSLTKA